MDEVSTIDRFGPFDYVPKVQIAYNDIEKDILSAHEGRKLSHMTQIAFHLLERVKKLEARKNIYFL